MIRKHTVLSLALLASTAACGGGGGGAPPPVSTSGGASPAPAAGSSSSPGIVLDQSGNPALLTIRVPAIGMDHTFALAGDGLQDATFNGIPVYNLGDAVTGQNLTHFMIKTDNNGNDVLVHDASELTSSKYGIWSHKDAVGNVTVGAFHAGDATPAADMPKTGSASYAGGVIGSGRTGTERFNLTGMFNATARFDTNAFDWNANLSASDASGAMQPWGTLTSSATIAPGTSRFAGTVTSSGASALLPNQVSGNLAGSFDGPGAREVGGVFGVSGGQTTAVGAFGGAVQPAAPSGVSGTWTSGAVFGSGSTFGGGGAGTAMGAIDSNNRLPSGNGAFGTLSGSAAGTLSGSAAGTLSGSAAGGTSSGGVAGVFYGPGAREVGGVSGGQTANVGAFGASRASGTGTVAAALKH